jgi:NurA-like 5'-3' nuclease
LRHGDEDEQGLRAWSRHYPDGLIELPNGERVAIEFERSNWKTTPRIKDIIKSYLDGSSAVKRINGVMYFAYNEGIKDKVARAITQAGGGRTIQVRMLSEIMQGRGAGDGTGA